ncbi:hypothetical protein Psi01_65750 [Planobispora siamensis]|uniref:Uncharacterized protein n=1 Tax=Planobispora siamensis TaxID=936338 RepID=A0A8J3WNL0_9ACTN|nr:hypothetical protein Psi01_65750 [Planobispora siamensis]
MSRSQDIYKRTNRHKEYVNARLLSSAVQSGERPPVEVLPSKSGPALTDATPSGAALEVQVGDRAEGFLCFSPRKSKRRQKPANAVKRHVKGT